MIVGIIPVRNEDWILDKSLSSISKICDKVLVALDECNDRSGEICDVYDNVEKIYVESNASGLDQNRQNRRQLLLERARELDVSPIIIAIDADEIFSSEIVSNHLQEQLMNLEPGNGFSVMFRELWFTPYLYRSEEKSSWSGRDMPCIWRDNGVDYAFGNRHEERIPSTIVLSRFDVDLLHFARVAPVRYWSRIRHYIAHEVVNLNITPIKANFFYSITRDESKMRLSVVPEKWYSQWVKNDNNFLRFEDGARNWFNDEILEMLLLDGGHKLTQCDIWDFDWVDYFKLVKNRVPDKNEESMLKDRRTRYQRSLQSFIRKNGRYPMWIPQFWIHMVVLILNRFGVYQFVHSLIKK